jgi:DNA-directed RNA polymerase alpha subunit
MAFCPHCGKRLEITVSGKISETQPEPEPQQQPEPAPNPLLDKGVHVLDIQEAYTRISNILERAGIDTVRDLTQLTVDDLAIMKNCGQKTINIIVDALGKVGLRLKDNGLSVRSAYSRTQGRILSEHGMPKGDYVVNGLVRKA